MDVLEVRNLTKKFGEFTAVDSISFRLKEGEILGLLGPNGAGKTTTLQMLLGILTPTSGTISYFGKDLRTHRSEIADKLNFSSTYTHLPWRLSVRENLTVFSLLYSISDRGRRLEKIKEAFRLEDLWDKPICELSAGQQTRVNLAKAFLNFPRVLLLDEPTASLDPEVAQHIHSFLQKQQDKFGVSIVITSHDMGEVEKLCDRVIFINNGQLIADDKPENLARSMDSTHVELMIKDGLKRTIEICRSSNLQYKNDGHHIVIDLKEKEIPYFLRDLLEKGIEYTEISIAKPTLQEYFLAQTGDRRKVTTESRKKVGLFNGLRQRLVKGKK